MRKFKRIYILILLLLLVVGSVVCFSYAYFVSKNEEHGKLNIVVGDLSYKIESDSLENNQITISSNETIEFELKITSLNEIDSKYELYYTSSDNSTTVYYDSDYDLPSDTITANGVKTLNIQITNNSDNDVTVTFGVQGGLVNHALSLNQGNKIDTAILKCEYAVGDVIATFDYTGDIQEFTAQCDGTYKLEVYGAQGGSTTSWNGIAISGGKGGYASGNIVLTKDTILYVGCGGAGVGTYVSPSVNSAGGWNGGGTGINSNADSTYRNCGGGGATHIAINEGSILKNTSKSNVLIVAGGGGGGYFDGPTNAAYTGGAGGTGGGGSYGQGSNTNWASGAGGGGWAGGSTNYYVGGNGGTSYIDGVTDGVTENGVRSGNGYAQVTYLGK